MLDSLRHDVTKRLAQIRPMTEDEQQAMLQEIERQRATMAAATELEKTGQIVQEASTAEGFDENDPSTWGNPGRNQPCPCGSGKKFKHCHGRFA